MVIRIIGQTRLSDAVYSLRYSPHAHNQLAMISCENFGIRGRSRLDLISTQDQFSVIWSDAIFDVSFVESDPSLIVTACGDGSILVWSPMQNKQTPILTLREHQREVWCVHWSESRSNDALLSTSADGSIKLWNLQK